MAELRLKQTGTIQLFENDNTSKITIASPASLGADRTITLPDADVTLASGTMLAADGSGASLTALNATQLSSGTVPDARFPATLPTASGASLTALNATEITSGTIPDDARLPTVGVDKGGTNLTSFATGDIVYASGTTAISKLAKPGTPDGEVLTFAACASAPSWAAAASGISWQSVQTSTPFTAVAGNGYPINTTSGAITMNLPAGVVGEQVAVVDYAGTFDSNALTIAADGSENIKGSNLDAEMSTERQAGVLTYVDATQGWVVTSAAPDPGVTQVAWITATGGTITTDGDYKVHTFNGDGTFEVTQLGTAGGSTSVDWLGIAGGGGGGYDVGGGAGAGGYRENYPNPITGGYPVSVTTYPITVGGGGTGGPSPVQKGNDTVLLGFTSTGGGAGGNYPGGSGQVGGSGGGGAGYGAPPGGYPGGAGNTPPVSSPGPQGNAGGNHPGPTPTTATGGSGGGAGAVGANSINPGPPSVGNTRTAGTASTISGSSVERGQGGRGQNDGGAAPPVNIDPAHPNTQAGQANKGGGGDGAGSDPVSGNAGGAGGSGVAIIRYKFQ